MAAAETGEPAADTHTELETGLLIAAFVCLFCFCSCVYYYTSEDHAVRWAAAARRPPPAARAAARAARGLFPSWHRTPTALDASRTAAG